MGDTMLSMKNTAPTAQDVASLGRRAAELMEVPRMIDRTLELLFAASGDAEAKGTLSKLRGEVQQHRQALIAKVGAIYSAVYSPEELKALVAFLESSAGKAMRAKQGVVEAKVQETVTAFLQQLIVGNRT
jgi:hypothetical protein